jgi:hypothetical protein
LQTRCARFAGAPGNRSPPLISAEKFGAPQSNNGKRAARALLDAGQQKLLTDFLRTTNAILVESADK